MAFNQNFNKDSHIVIPTDFSEQYIELSKSKNGQGTVLSRAKEVGDISDGYHTFNQLYDYRMVYNALLVNQYSLNKKYNCHKSKKHNDGELCFGGGWFIVSMQLPTGQVTNHYEEKYWDLFVCEEREKADKWDGHSPEEAFNRMVKFAELQGDVQKRKAVLVKELNDFMSSDRQGSLKECATHYKVGDKVIASVFKLGEFNALNADIFNGKYKFLTITGMEPEKVGLSGKAGFNVTFDNDTYDYVEELSRNAQCHSEDSSFNVFFSIRKFVFDAFAGKDFDDNDVLTQLEAVWKDIKSVNFDL